MSRVWIHASEGGEKKNDASAKMICVACFISTMQKTTTYKFTFALCANVTKIRDDIAPYNTYRAHLSPHYTIQQHPFALMFGPELE